MDKESTIVIDQSNLNEALEMQKNFNSISVVLSSLMFSVLLFLPSVTEIIIITQSSLYQQHVTLIVCSVILSVLAIYGGIQFGMIGACCHASGDANQIWCISPTNFRNMLTPAYMIYFLSPWATINMIMLWVVSSGKEITPWYIHLLCYMAPMIYFINMIVGYAWKRSRTNNYQVV